MIDGAIRVGANLTDTDVSPDGDLMCCDLGKAHRVDILDKAFKIFLEWFERFDAASRKPLCDVNGKQSDVCSRVDDDIVCIQMQWEIRWRVTLLNPDLD